jgi:hypothetical protein
MSSAIEIRPASSGVQFQLAAAAHNDYHQPVREEVVPMNVDQNSGVRLRIS